jgi:uncharacterized membrane protein YgcG
VKQRFLRAGIISLVVTLVASLGIVLVTVFDDGADLSYRTLDYDATITADGDLKVTQHIDMKLLKRTDDDDNVRPWKQLYQQYRLTANLSDISDITVKNVTDGTTYTQTDPKLPSEVSSAQWDSDYADHWYIADVSDGESSPRSYTPGADALDPGSYSHSKTVEIGWNIPATTKADSLRFDVGFIMHDVATKWDDIASLQWEPFGKSNQVPIGTVTGTVRFPEGITASDSWVWLHTERTSETSRNSDGSFAFKAYNVNVGDYLDVVAAFDAAEAGNIARTEPGSRLPSLKRSEAQQERQWQDQQRAAAIHRIMLWVATILVGLALCIWAIRAVLVSNKSSQYHGPIEYWRDQPGLSPASAAKLIDIVDQAPGNESNRQLTATMLSLAVKKAIAIYPGPADMYRGVDMSQTTPVGLSQMIAADPGKMNAATLTSTIVILPMAIDGSPNAGQLGLSQSEDALLDLLIAISHRVGCPVFDLVQMKESCKDWQEGYKELEKFTNSCSVEFTLLDAAHSSVWQWLTGGLLTALLGCCSIAVNISIGYLVAGLITGIPLLLVGVFCTMAGAHYMLTERGQEYAGKCLGLKRYMQDFSDFSDRGTADLTLWDWYMVYAAAFGISEKVMQELAKAYPQVSDPAWLDANASATLFYWSYRPYGWYGHRYYDDGAFPGGAGGTGSGPVPAFGGSSFAAGFSDIGSQLSSGFADITSTISAAAPSSSSGGSGGSGFGGGFGGSSGGSGGGSFGGR